MEPSTARSRRRKEFTLSVGTWNVRSLLESEGPVQTASTRHQVADDKKIYRIIQIFKRLGLEIVCLQETYWLDKNVYNIDGAVLISSGRPSPGEGESCRRGEGVAILLLGNAARAWRDGGCQYDARSSRIVSARLKFDIHGCSPVWYTVISAYAPTFASKRIAKEQFFADLQATLPRMGTEKFILLGDFNARVGSRTHADADEWSRVRGPHGVGEMNSAGRELLDFLATIQAMVCNTWFCKTEDRKWTWQHPRSKRFHCIDFVITSQADYHQCIDAQVIRSAECGSDHNLVAARFVVGRLQRRSRCVQTKKCKRFDVARLKDVHSTDSSGNITRVADVYRECLTNSLQQPNEHTTVECKWSRLRTAVTESAEETLGFQKRRQPDWFTESKDTLEPLLNERNQRYQEWISSGRSDDTWNRFKAARSKARAAVRSAKNSWFTNKAKSLDGARFSSSRVWACVKDMQAAKQGLRPVSTTAIRDANGNICKSVEEQGGRWYQHFDGVLNIPSTFDPCAIDEIDQQPINQNIAGKPDAAEVARAIRQLSNGKAAGASAILPELVKAGGESFMEALLDLLHHVWDDEAVPQEWVDCNLVPIPKKGNLSLCDNWRGISLLDVVGKVAARVLQSRLQIIAENILPDSQCGFRKGRSCTDMVFAVRQVLEKLYEHRCPGYVVFVDLRKAYDSVNRECMWLILAKAGVPSNIVNIIKSFHTSMSATLSIGSTPIQPIAVKSGLRQGCCMAPVLFNIFMWAVFQRWSRVVEHVPGIGVPLAFNPGGSLYFKRKRTDDQTTINDCQFADDSALFATTRTAAALALDMFIDVSSAFGLTVNLDKTKFMAVGYGITDDDRLPLPVKNGTLECVREFRYLGAVIHDSGRSHKDVSTRVSSASRAFGALRHAVFNDHNLSLRTKRLVFEACVLSLLLYCAETWVPLQSDVQRITTFYYRSLLSIMSVAQRDVWDLKIAKDTILKTWNAANPLDIPDRLMQRRLEWLGHVVRMPEERMPRMLLFGTLLPPRPACGPRKRWRDAIRVDLRRINIADESWFDTAQERSEWRQAYRAIQPAQKPAREIVCEVCRRAFARQQDIARHKCIMERRKPVQQQANSRQCSQCHRWFRSAGGIAVHRCVQSNSAPNVANATSSSPVRLCIRKPCCTAHCPICERCCKSIRGFAIHNCNRSTRRPTADERDKFQLQCQNCRRRFKRRNDLSRHQRSCLLSSPSRSTRNT